MTQPNLSLSYKNLQETFQKGQGELPLNSLGAQRETRVGILLSWRGVLGENA